ncbi:GDP-fucose protein O-fucosyltransferase 1-like [Tubulanus polymorphus]|uniref:GDP-fucose protein O-fucosyltransferase 1-like n=1 Tax=Tubulanus polymorphus TaxID=672921 RepID=UPI003DA56D19
MMSAVSCSWFYSSLLLLMNCFFIISSTVDIDKNGYIMFCPCMGRFGNQADQFLGSLAFAYELNRTLVLPGWVEYPPEYASHSVAIPFDRYFNVESLRSYHRVITAEQFMKELAATVWPEDKRTVFCFSSRMGPKKNDCNAKDGNPFGPFWDAYGVDFTRSEFYEGLDYESDLHKWQKRYPASEYPVLAFTGAPGRFPVSRQNAKLHKYLIWSNYIQRLAQEFIRKHVASDGPFVGIHLRNGPDWKGACTHITSDMNLFASSQCLGVHLEHGKPTKDLCFPSKKTVLHQTKQILKKLKARTLFVASDHDYMIEDFEKYFKNMKPKVSVVRRFPTEPHVDLAILGSADHYIGNCVSSFSAFAKRERDVNSLPSSFWAFPRPATKKSKDEL